MKVESFLADTVADAVAQIRAQLGPEAVVLHVRPVPASGLGRIWRKPRLEVLACRPELVPQVADALSDLRQQLAEIRGQLPAATQPLNSQAGSPSGTPTDTGLISGSDLESVLTSSGMLPLYARRIADEVHAQVPAHPANSLAEELALARSTLARHWRKPPPTDTTDPRPHVLIGPAGVGKTTCLCKWLTQAVLVEGRPARVWRLEGATANTAESLSIYCEILGVPIEVLWTPVGETETGLGFIDLPGVDWRNQVAVSQLAEQLRQYALPHTHLVLNAAYETPLLLAQVRAFANLPVEDVILTHLDEEPCWGKLWNLVLGTNCTVGYLSAGQNIPGEFAAATLEKIFSRQFP